MNKTLRYLGLLTFILSIIGYTFISKTDQKVYAYENNNGNNSSNFRRGWQYKADLFGISIEELNKLRDSGMPLLEIAESKGISEEDFHKLIQDKALERWKALGFSDQEIQNRLTEMKERQDNCDGTGINKGRMGKSQYNRFNRNQ